MLQQATLFRKKIDVGIGLRDLVSFNQAMLAKTYWRILNNLDTLMSLVLKYKFFPNCSFVDSTKGKNSSFLWFSLSWGRDLISKGIDWKVKSGNSIKVWDHNWIPSITFFKPFRNKSSPFPNLHVAKLLDQQSDTWNMAIISRVFKSIDIELITTIPLEADLRIRMPSRNGNFIVKSTYFFVDSLDKEASSSSSNPPNGVKNSENSYGLPIYLYV